MPEDHKNMKKVQCWIPQDTWNKIVSLGYDSPTIAVTKAFEKLLEDPLKIPEISPNDPRVNPLVSPKDPIESPDIPVYKVKIEALEMVLAEKDRSIERLENDLKKADIDKEDLKAMHNNYMLQVQSLINARALTPPGSTEGEKEERVFEATQDSPTIKESPDTEPEKGHIEKICKYCGEPFYTDNIQKEYCSKDHKDKAYNEKRKQERENRKNEELNLKKKG
jgi:hypothetical protein